MPTIELTENLRSTIRTLRKSKKKRGDELSKELGKGASYISQVENGKIKEMDFSLLNKIFRKITDLSDDEYIKFIDDLIDDNALHMSKDELKHEQWIHQFDYEIRKFPISDSLIEFISSTLNELNYTPQQFVDIINQNRALDSISDSDLLPENKLETNITPTAKGYYVQTTIRFHLPSTFLDNILTKKVRTISYIYMQGILFNLFLSEGFSILESQDKSKALLKSNGFLTIKERNKLICQNIKEKTEKNESFTLYDVQPTDYDRQYVSIKDEINSGFDALRDQNMIYTIERLEVFLKNMHEDLGLTVAIMSAPFNQIPQEKRKQFFSEYAALLKSYITKSPQE